MKLLRLATVYIQPKPSGWNDKRFTIGSTTVEPIESWPLDGKLRLLVAASVPLPKYPPVTEEDVVLVPEEPRREAENAIRAYANTIATLGRASRSISSPAPYVGFLPETDAERTWLESKVGLKGGFSGRPGSRPRIELTEDIVQGVADRLDGLELSAEALSQPRATGKFREYIRLFERAFRLRSKERLVERLSVFLEPNGQGYTRVEVRDWLVKKRHPVTHAAQRGAFLVESDIAPIVQRVEQAGYDVLFNKIDWGTPSIARRDLWSPEAGTSDSGTSLFLTQGKGATLEFQLFDRLGGFPADLSVSLSSTPKEWWTKDAEAKPRR